MSTRPTMSSVASFSDPSDAIEIAPFSVDEGPEMQVSYEESQDMPAENQSGRILGVDPLVTASDLGII